MWQEKAHRLIAEMCEASYRQSNPPGKRRHVPYSVPALAQELVACLNANDEERAKAVFPAYDVLPNEYKA